MILLPPKPDRLDLNVFWISLSIVAVATVGWAAYPSIIAPLFVAALSAVIGIRFPNVVKRGYAFWRSLGRFYVRLARIWSIGVCFYVILGITGSTRRNLFLSRPPKGFSMWAPWITPEAALYSKPIETARRSRVNTYWLTSYLAWAKNPRHLWAVSLLPFVLLLRLVEGGEKREFPSNIYTLY